MGSNVNIASARAEETDLNDSLVPVSDLGTGNPAVPVPLGVHDAGAEGGDDCGTGVMVRYSSDRRRMRGKNRAGRHPWSFASRGLVVL
jgi:hypothetical protein